MTDPSPRRRVALLLLVVLVVLQPGPASVRADAAAGTGAGDVGDAVGSAVERHPSSAGATADALRRVRADAVHARGLRGEGVDVGVVGRGFGDSRVVAPHVVERRQIGDPARATRHDTAVAAVVSETAPAADLYLAGVGPTPTPAEYAAAVEWLTASGVDVIVDSGSYFPSVARDERRITAAAERAAAEGVVFVTSAGNYANRHWAGTGTREGWVTFADDDAANALADGERLSGQVTVRLRWRSAADYDLYLYRHLPDAPDRVVAKSVADTTGPGRSVEAVDVAVPRGRYYVAVYADDPASDPGRVQVFAARNRLEHATAHGSMVAPATGENVVAVGAVADGERLPYSSLSANGTVDLSAPADAGTDLAGTSVAAPYVAGTAALMVSGDGDPSPARVESILERTADGERDALDALAAVEAATTDGASDPPASRWSEAGRSGGEAAARSSGDGRSRNVTRGGGDAADGRDDRSTGSGESAADDGTAGSDEGRSATGEEDRRSGDGQSSTDDGSAENDEGRSATGEEAGGTEDGRSSTGDGGSEDGRSTNRDTATDREP
jgi:hypothetical protein